MPYRSKRKQRAYFNNYYVQNSQNIKARGRSLYQSDPDKIKAVARTSYHADPDKKKAAVTASYVADPDKKKAAVRALYVADPDKKKVASRALYMLNPLKKNSADRAAYRDNADRRRAAAKACYDANPRLKCEASKAAYKTNPDEMKALFRDYHASHRSARLRYFRKYHSYTKLKRVTKARYSLAQPNQLSIEKYFRNVQVNILADHEVLLKLKEEFKSLHASVADTLSRAELEKTVGRLSVKRLVCKTLQIRRKHAGFLVATLSLFHLKNAMILEKAAILVVQSPSFMRQPTCMLEIPQYLLMRRGSVLLLKKCLWGLAVRMKKVKMLPPKVTFLRLGAFQMRKFLIRDLPSLRCGSAQTAANH